MAKTTLKLSELSEFRKKLVKGQQVIYVPEHAFGDLEHPSAERGLVSDVGRGLGTAWVRYFFPGPMLQLRNRANPEGTDLNDIYPGSFMSPELAALWMKAIDSGNLRLEVYTGPDLCSMFTIEEFLEDCRTGGFIDYDGHGYLSDGQLFDKEFPISPSRALRSGDKYLKTKYTHVVWFNR